MQSLKKISGLIVRLNTKVPAFSFSGDVWKDRDGAAEKVFITQAQKQSNQRLVQKIKEDDYSMMHQTGEFERKLRVIFSRYSVENDPMFSEISNLHKVVIK